MMGPYDKDIGGIVRVNFVWTRNGKQDGPSKERSCIILGSRGDFILVAPITHDPAGQKLRLPAPEMRSARLDDEGQSHVALDQVNIVHINSSQLKTHAQDGSRVRGKVSMRTVEAIRAANARNTAARTLEMKIHEDDTTDYRPARAIRPASESKSVPGVPGRPQDRPASATPGQAAPVNRPLVPGHPDKAEERTARAMAQAQHLAVKHGAAKSRPTLTLKSRAEGRER